MTRIAIYPGSFDPPTRGHEDLIRRAQELEQPALAITDHGPSRTSERSSETG
jgi:pantetheine-phosphate adenylyltransferase